MGAELYAPRPLMRPRRVVLLNPLDPIQLPWLLFYKTHASVSPLESALLQVLVLNNLKSFRINTYKKTGGRRRLWLTSFSLLVNTLRLPFPSPLARAWTERGARCEWTRPHPEVRSQGRRNVPQEVPAAGAAAVAGERARRAGGVGAQPVAAGGALRIDTLHGQAGQVVHEIFPQWPFSLCRNAWQPERQSSPERPK